ncbi:MAG: VOC family protein [Cytophagales bacterium]|nr:VOC family protein [Bernardetiaceae bacterium]MDW8210938.1 VOC family protein [Cytophagales bacterium]
MNRPHATIWAILLLISGKIGAQTMSYQIAPFREVVFSVGNLTATENFYANVLRWQVVYRGSADKALLRAWGLPESASAEEVVLASPDKPEHGRLRLMQFKGVSVGYIRPGGKIWDTGGIYDIDLRCAGIHALYDTLREHGWHGLSNPIHYQMGPFEVWELLVKGHDDIVIAFIERLNPPLPQPPPRQWAFGNIINSAQIVKDYDRAKDFYLNQLGFVQILETTITNPTPGENILGLPYNLSTQVKAKLLLFSPDGKGEGMMELLAMEGATGADFSSNAVPPNRGVLMCRYPVKNIDGYYEKIIRNGVKPVVNLQQIFIGDIGKVKMFAVRSPEGAWIEFFEAL